MKTILFVCTGNTCRSPMAAGMCTVMLRERGVTDVCVLSCGTSAFSGMPVSDCAVAAAAVYGADIASHRARPLSRYLLESADLLVCMTESHRALLADFLPPEKLRVLGGGVSDPFGGSQAQYDACAKQIHAGLESLLDEVLQNEQ